jgi:hypothetical protein
MTPKMTPSAVSHHLPAVMFGARSTGIPLDSTCHQNYAENGSDQLSASRARLRKILGPHISGRIIILKRLALVFTSNQSRHAGSFRKQFSIQ